MIEKGGEIIMFFYPTILLQDRALLYSSNAVKDVDPFDPLTLTPDEEYFFKESLHRQLEEVWALTFRLTYQIPDANFLLKIINLSTTFDPPPGYDPNLTLSNTDSGSTVEASGFKVRKAVNGNGTSVANDNALTVIDGMVEAVMVYGILADWYMNKQAPEAGKYYTAMAQKSLTDLKNNLYELYKLPL